MWALLYEEWSLPLSWGEVDRGFVSSSTNQTWLLHLLRNIRTPSTEDSVGVDKRTADLGCQKPGYMNLPFSI